MNKILTAFIRMNIFLYAFLITYLWGSESLQIVVHNTASDIPVFLLVSKLGISEIIAAQVVDAVSAGSTAMSIASIVLATTGAGLVAAGGIGIVKAMIKNCGKRHAISY